VFSRTAFAVILVYYERPRLTAGFQALGCFRDRHGLALRAAGVIVVKRHIDVSAFVIGCLRTSCVNRRVTGSIGVTANDRQLEVVEKEKLYA
jgi:hypothetical protein